MFAQDRKVIAGMSNVSGFKSFDQDTVTSFLAGSSKVSTLVDYAKGFFLLQSGEVVPKNTADLGEGFGAAVKGGYRGIVERLSADATSKGVDGDVWAMTPTAITRNVATVVALVGYDNLMVMSASEVWATVQALATEHGTLSGYYNANLAPKKDGQETRPPKSARELFATAARQALAENLGREDAVRYAMEAVADVFGGE